MNPQKLILELIVSGLERKSAEVESIAISLSRVVKKNDPELSRKIAAAVSAFSFNPSLARGLDEPIPTDEDSRLEMVNLISPNLDLHLEPILNNFLKEKVENFLDERRRVPLLLERGIRPSTSLLLIGQSGTGKTMLARYIASSLGLNLVVLDLSSSISSLLGKTGQNLKRVLSYARETGSVLLLDEFDAIAKRRDDNTDLGEVKRVVNILLIELESWPVSSMVIATSNHPELLDRAIWRRFDHILEIDHPGDEERVALLKREFGDFWDGKNESLIRPVAELLKGKSAADVCKFSDSTKRRIVLKKEDPALACIQELELITNDKKIRGKFCVLAKELLGDSITVRELGDMTGLSPAGVQHHLSKEKV